MSWVPAEQVMQAVARQRQALAVEESRIQNFAAYHANERRQLVSEQQAAVRDLGQAILPVLDDASVARVAELVGLPGLVAEGFPQKREARRAWLRGRLDAILHDPRFVNRELLRHPRTGSLTTAIAEAEDFRRPILEVITTCEGHPMFDRLMATGFGTPAHTTSWWRYSYWQERSAAAEIVALFSNKATFAEVRDEYERARETIAVQDAELAKLRAEVAEGEALDGEYAKLYDEHQSLDTAALEFVRGRIVQHLLLADAGLVAQRLRVDSALHLLFLRASGVTSKITYLDGIQQKSLDEMKREVATIKQRLDNAQRQTQKRWAPMPIDKFQKLAEDRQPKREKRWQRFNKVYTQVHSYDRWDHARGYESLLWWDLMTRGRYDGSYIPEVSQFREQHPDYSFDPDWKRLAVESDVYTAEHDSPDDADAAAASTEADTLADRGDAAGDADVISSDAS